MIFIGVSSLRVASASLMANGVVSLDLAATRLWQSGISARVSKGSLLGKWAEVLAKSEDEINPRQKGQVKETVKSLISETEEQRSG